MTQTDEQTIGAPEDLPSSEDFDEEPEERFFPVEIDFLKPGTDREFHLYTKQGGQFLLFRSPEVPLSAEDASLLRRRGSHNLYVRESERGKYAEYMESSMLRALLDDSMPVEQKADTVYETGARVLSDTLAVPESKENVLRSQTVVSAMSRFIDQTPEALWLLVFKDRRSEYEVAHSLNSCALALGLAARLGVEKEEEVRALGVGCLLKDIGQRRIPAEVLDKPGKLTDEEWAEVRRHPLLSLQMLESNDAVDELSRVTIVQHHEMIDGSGYPHGRSGREVHLFSRITAVADIFDALTSDRPYSNRLEPFPALMLMKKAYAGRIDPNVFRAFVLLLKG